MYRIAVTNRHLCQEDFLVRMHKLASDSGYDAILLREKDMAEGTYRKLAKEVLAICRKSGKKCILHTYWQMAEDIGHPLIHLPLPVFRALPAGKKAFFTEIGTSVHSMDQAAEAEKLGASYITAGHIFTTACKTDLPPRGLDFLKKICTGVSIPVYGIGGICHENEKAVTDMGACGVCIMSGAMR